MEGLEMDPQDFVHAKHMPYHGATPIFLKILFSVPTSCHVSIPKTLTLFET